MTSTNKECVELHGFNNLTKSLRFNMYDICYTKTKDERTSYIEYIDTQYNATRLTTILTTVVDMIGANVLNIATQDYVPQGASAAILVSDNQDEEVTPKSNNNSLVPHSENVAIQLDKSHITVHTYPEFHPYEGISTFRADIDVATCGEISPLKALHYLIHCFDPDIMTIDYQVRGFTRDTNGQKLFIDHHIQSIQDFIPAAIQCDYEMTDSNLYQANIFHTKCKRKEFIVDNYLIGKSSDNRQPREEKEIVEKLKAEINEIFNGRANTTKAAKEEK